MGLASDATPGLEEAKNENRSGCVAVALLLLNSKFMFVAGGESEAQAVPVRATQGEVRWCYECRRAKPSTDCLSTGARYQK